MTRRRSRSKLYLKFNNMSLEEIWSPSRALYLTGELRELAELWELTGEELDVIGAIVNRHREKTTAARDKTVERTAVWLELSIGAIRSDPLIHYLICTSFNLNNVHAERHTWTWGFYRKNGGNDGNLITTDQEWFWLIDDSRYWAWGDRSNDAFNIGLHSVEQDWSLVIYLAFSDNRFDNRKNLSGLAVKIPNNHPNRDNVKRFLLDWDHMVSLFKEIMPPQFTDPKEWDWWDIWDRISKRAISSSAAQ